MPIGCIEILSLTLECTLRLLLCQLLIGNARLTQEIVRRIARQLRDELWIKQLLRPRGSRLIRPFLRGSFTLVAVVPWEW